MMAFNLSKASLFWPLVAMVFAADEMLFAASATRFACSARKFA